MFGGVANHSATTERLNVSWCSPALFLNLTDCMNGHLHHITCLWLFILCRKKNRSSQFEPHQRCCRRVPARNLALNLPRCHCQKPALSDESGFHPLQPARREDLFDHHACMSPLLREATQHAKAYVMVSHLQPESQTATSTYPRTSVTRMYVQRNGLRRASNSSQPESPSKRHLAPRAPSLKLSWALYKLWNMRYRPANTSTSMPAILPCNCAPLSSTSPE